MCLPVLCFVAIAHTILLAVGYLHRLDKASLKRTSGSSTFLRMVSNRLSASVPRARFLGMVVAVAVSQLVDKPDQVMNFGVEEMDSEEARQWLDLVHIHDKVGKLGDLPTADTESPKKRVTPPETKLVQPKRVSLAPQAQTTKIIAIEELSDSDSAAHKSDEDEDDDLRPYAAPDSDASDSDDDPTLVNRNKPIAPVYITSLIKQLNLNDDLPAMELALKTAPSLIRRKANFGDEVSSNIMLLASTFLNLQEIASMEDTQRLRLESWIACLVAKPAIVGPWIASTYFEGDLPLSTRSALLTAIALGSRELAGFKDDVEEISARTGVTEPSFPSKRLPSHLDRTYASTSTPIDGIAKTLSYRTLQPMALEAADKMTGPNILKIRTFSSRMQVAAKNAAISEARSKRIPPGSTQTARRVTVPTTLFAIEPPTVVALFVTVPHQFDASASLTTQVDPSDSDHPPRNARPKCTATTSTDARIPPPSHHTAHNPFPSTRSGYPPSSPASPPYITRPEYRSRLHG